MQTKLKAPPLLNRPLLWHKSLSRGRYQHVLRTLSAIFNTVKSTDCLKQRTDKLGLEYVLKRHVEESDYREDRPGIERGKEHAP
jgi:hypothetical protein